jgi:hypothetical protein
MIPDIAKHQIAFMELNIKELQLFATARIIIATTWHNIPENLHLIYVSFVNGYLCYLRLAYYFQTGHNISSNLSLTSLFIIHNLTS